MHNVYNIINGIAPTHLKSEFSIACQTGHERRSADRACLVPRVSLFYTDIKLICVYCSIVILLFIY